YANSKKRIVIARKIVEGAAFNMLKNLRYYNRRDRDTEGCIERIEELSGAICGADNIEQLMGIEGNIRMCYYQSFEVIINDFEMGNRTRQPPSNEVNCLISFLNSMCYTMTLDAIYHTQLNPTIS